MSVVAPKCRNATRSTPRSRGLLAVDALRLACMRLLQPAGFRLEPARFRFAGHDGLHSRWPDHKALPRRPEKRHPFGLAVVGRQNTRAALPSAGAPPSRSRRGRTRWGQARRSSSHAHGSPLGAHRMQMSHAGASPLASAGCCGAPGTTEWPPRRCSKRPKVGREPCRDGWTRSGGCQRRAPRPRPQEMTHEGKSTRKSADVHAPACDTRHRHGSALPAPAQGSCERGDSPPPHRLVLLW
jgi:hypothetical protein